MTQKLNFKEDRQTLLKARAVMVKHLGTMAGHREASRDLMKIIQELDVYVAAITRHLEEAAK